MKLSPPVPSSAVFDAGTACWFYGHDPVEHADLVTDGLLPKDRAGGCADEYRQLDRSWSKLLNLIWTTPNTGSDRGFSPKLAQPGVVRSQFRDDYRLGLVRPATDCALQSVYDPPTPSRVADGPPDGPHSPARAPGVKSSTLPVEAGLTPVIPCVPSAIRHFHLVCGASHERNVSFR